MSSPPSLPVSARSKVRHRILGFSAVLFFLGGCPEDVAQTRETEEQETVTQAGYNSDAGVSIVEQELYPFHPRFRPQEGLTPYPMAGLLHENNLWRDSLTETVQYLAGFASRGAGFPTTQILSVPFSQKPQLSSLSGNLLVLETASQEAIEGEFSWDDAREELIFHPSNPFEPGSTIQLLFRGGTTGIQSEEGESLAAPVLFSECMYQDRVNEDCASFYPDPESLEELATTYGFSEENLAFTYSVPITSHTEAQGSVYFAQGTFPDDLHWKKDDGRTFAPDWLYPQKVADVLADVKTEIETQNAFSLTGGLFFSFANANSPLNITASNKSALFYKNVDINEHTELERKAFEDPHVLQMRPDLTLEPNTTYTYRLHGLTDRGLDVVPQERLPILMGPDILNDDGSINVPGLSAGQAAALSTMQRSLRPYISQWQIDGVDPLSLTALGTFTTLSASDILISHREELQTQTLNLNFDNTELKTPFSRGLLLLWPDVETVYSGEATIWSWIEPNTRRRVAEPAPVKTEFVLTLPEAPEDQSNVPVVLFGHGINTSAELVYGVANFLAEAGYASFAIDLPYHGMRSPCTEDSQCSGWSFLGGGSTCRGDGQCINSDGSLDRVRKSPNLFAGGPEVAITTGTHFFEIDDLIATRDHFQQALTDQMQAIQILQNNDWVSQTGYGLNTEQMFYLGISLGSILGATLSPIEPSLTTFAFNVGGADVTRLLQNSTALGVVLAGFLNDYDVQETDFDYEAYTFFARWLLDPIDPINMVQHTIDAPLPGMLAKKALIQLAVGDLVVPNITTELLAERMKHPYQEFSPLISNHGFLVDPTSFEGGDAREQIVDFFNQTP